MSIITHCNNELSWHSTCPYLSNCSRAAAILCSHLGHKKPVPGRGSSQSAGECSVECGESGLSDLVECAGVALNPVNTGVNVAGGQHSDTGEQ